MWTALAITAALSAAPEQGGDLRLANVRATNGIMGGPRKDAEAPKLLVGDALVLSFDIEGLKVGEDGRVLYSIGMELKDKNDKVLYKEEPQDLEIFNSLGGTRVPAFVATQTGVDTPPGDYFLTAIVKDRAAKTEKKETRKFQVLPVTFGLVRMSLSFDDRGLIPAPPVCVPGQRLLVNF